MFRRFARTATTALTCTGLLATPLLGAAQAATPPGMEDLIGVRGSSAESDLGRRGYAYQKSLGSAGLWWNQGSRSCVSVAVDNGRVASIEPASASDCGKGGGGGNTAAGVAAGALAVGLIAALSSHHKGTNNRSNNDQFNGEYGRGYHDALDGRPYSRDDSEAYHSGFMAGEAERGNRRASGTRLVQGAPRAAQEACARSADQFWGFPSGSAVPVSVFDYGQGNYEITVASGHSRARCSVNAQGRVSDIQPG